VGDPEMCATWDDVFQVRHRWTDYLDSAYCACLKIFGSWAKHRGELTVEVAVDLLNRLVAAADVEALHAGAFFKKAIFELWLSRLQNGNSEAERLLFGLRETALISG
jgi:hypothetical protein